ncbi:MAG: sensor histidine kinase, partial [Solirubrobacterales bacterium]
AAGVALEVEAPDETVELDGTRARQALDNLIENALRHTPPGGLVRVAAAAGGETVTIEVDDTGTGFDPSELDAVFQPFNRGRAAVHEGSGLGLAIVRAIAEAHDGGVTAANRLEGGARVALSLATPAPPRSPASRHRDHAQPFFPAAGSAPRATEASTPSGAGSGPSGSA